MQLTIDIILRLCYTNDLMSSELSKPVATSPESHRLTLFEHPDYWEAFQCGLRYFTGHEEIVPNLYARILILHNLAGEIELSAVKHELAEARVQANTSPVTGLPNKSAFNQEVATRIATNKPFALAVVDITHFKGVNDRYGHKTGDDFLDGSGKLFKASLELPKHTRDEDYVAHLSGDEFAIVFCMEQRAGETLTPEQRVEAIRDNLINNMARYAGLCLAPELNVAAAIGIAVHQDGETGTQTFERADAVMYEHKKVQHGLSDTEPR